MSSSPDDADVGPLVADLVRTLQELEEEFEPRTERGLPRPPSPRELMRFTSDVGIPGVILLLRTNIEALKLLQRALRMADGRTPTTGTGSTEVRQRAEQLSRTTLSRLDGALADLQDAVEGRPEDDDARELLDEARGLQNQVEAKLRERADDDPAADSTDSGVPAEPVPDESVPVDVDAELESIKEEFGDGNGDSEGDATGDGDGSGDDRETGDQGDGSGDDAGN
ncbi:hypothetical protein SAMN05216559_3120 [Halomicrobium zhouii]|uniref:Uncharacterized protein n=1 Tax=Halomicrobium zhouii TaxID=767519 RepID=A0A1I6LU15_9EURY|nr:hypothetical protein [Halomicrobium zhouii]SFS06908.1 hypothetical protein SAMN05216559_3120 [Halomicrobium zhouii]